MLLRNAHIGFNGPLRDIELIEGRISAIGPELTGGGGVDVEGATVLPGLWDSHVHLAQWAQARRRIDLSGARSAAETVALAREALGALGASGGSQGAAGSGGSGGSGGSKSSGGSGGSGRSGVVMGFGFRDALWPDVPHKDLLPDHPVALASKDLHTVWFSAAALALIGLGDHPTGVLRERDCYEAMAALPPPPQDEIDAWTAEAAREAAARGVVGVIDFEYADNWTDWRRRTTVRDIPIRVVCSIPVARLDDAIERGLRAGQTEGLLEVGPVKMFVDGSLNTRTAYCDDPYPGGTHQGLLEMPFEELAAAMAKAHAHGLQPAVHAIGDHAVAIALDAFEQVGCPGRIEHAQLVRSADLARFARPGLIA